MFKRKNLKFAVLAILAICMLSLGLSPSLSTVRATELTDSQVNQIKNQAILKQAGVDEMVFLDNASSKKQFGEEMIKHPDLKKYLDKEKKSLNFDLEKTYGVKVKKQNMYYTSFTLQGTDGMSIISGLFNHSNNTISKMAISTTNFEKREITVKTQDGQVTTYSEKDIETIKAENSEKLAKSASEMVPNGMPKKYTWKWFLTQFVCKAAGQVACFGACAVFWEMPPVMVLCKVACDYAWGKGICQR
ncbi:hypothetical protein SAMN04487866_11957 [Thermoactinomyces sp. DSM 45891]|uniref:hypothetical protein n=1 Tax=Thermoactinomyces sp. DSM 45891 TaxID=1761907 RepID=UPI00091FDA16|nr:hypothetical protein [Thermoactinomyces sp. DSM 45891]SFX71802.1 hypothetical protein SAMN04487866_11957 [Thermoactinomyces sp. DSM 45891]